MDLKKKELIYFPIARIKVFDSKNNVVYLINAHPVSPKGIYQLPQALNQLLKKSELNQRDYSIELYFHAIQFLIKIPAKLSKIEIWKEVQESSRKQSIEFCFLFMLSSSHKHELNTVTLLLKKTAKELHIHESKIFSIFPSRRKHQREESEYNVYLDLGFYTYSMTLSNLSLGGFSVQSELPFYAPPIAVGEIHSFYVEYQKERYYFKGRILVQQESFQEMDAGQKKNLLYMLYQVRFYEVHQEAQLLLKKVLALSQKSNQPQIHSFKKK